MPRGAGAGRDHPSAASQRARTFRASSGTALADRRRAAHVPLYAPDDAQAAGEIGIRAAARRRRRQRRFAATSAAPDAGRPRIEERRVAISARVAARRRQHPAPAREPGGHCPKGGGVSEPNPFDADVAEIGGYVYTTNARLSSRMANQRLTAA